MAGRVLVRNRAPANRPRESGEDSNDQLDGDQTLDILLGFATSAFLGVPISGEVVSARCRPKDCPSPAGGDGGVDEYSIPSNGEASHIGICSLRRFISIVTS
jgi:hypothetical protein